MLKNKFPKKYYILATVLVVAIFIVTGYILAADDNANQPSCSSDIWNCDNSSSAFQSIAGFDWTSNGYSGGAGNPECCGDDSQETYRTCGTDLNIAWSCSADACCPSYTYCVDKNSNCKYAGLTAAIPYSNLNPGSNDNTAVCRGGGWEDCDFEWPGQGYYCGGEGDLCGETVVSGESGVGEYEFAGQTACCGDDSQEVYNECYTTSDVEWRGGIASPISYTCASTASACCSSDKCVGPNGNCYSQGLPIQFYSSGNDQSVLCYVWGGSPFTTTGWGDCDYNDCGPSVCIGSHGVTPGETGVGEYDINSDITGECCGDDTNEYYITDFCPGYSGPGKCCNNANDKIDASGNCVSSCDNEDPTVDAFSVNGNTNDFNTCDTSLDIAWTVSDTGGSGLNRVEVWRKTDGGAWTEVHQESLSGNGPVSGSWTDNVSCSGDHHTYEYGIHVIDNADNMGTEDSTITATLVCTPNAVSYSSFSTCPQPPPGGNDICFTNIESIGMRLRWNDNSNNEDGFYIYRDNPTKLVWTNNPNDDSKKFLDLACNTEYTYWVSAFNTYAGLTCESDKKDGSERTLGCGPDFGIQVEPGSQSINYINTAYYIVTLTSYNNFDDNVDLSASNCPAGATCSFEPDSVDLDPGSSEQSIFSVSNASYNPSGYAITVTGRRPPLSHSRVVTLIVNDAIAPQVDELTADTFGLESSPVTNTNGHPDVGWEVSESTRGSGLDFVQVWRKDSACLGGASWAQVSADIDQTGFSDSGTWQETESLENGTYCYGVHVNDIAGNSATEQDSGEGPIEVIIAKPVADFTFCKSTSTDYQVEFTNTSHRYGYEHPDSVIDTWNHYWDFYSGDGVDLPANPDSTQKEPTYNYAPLFAYTEPETRLALEPIQGKTAGLSTEQLADEIMEHPWWQKIIDFFVNLWNGIKDFFKDILIKSTDEAQAQELVDLRTYNSSTFKNPDGTYTLKAHVGHINYQDKTGRFQPIDTTLIEDENGWYQNQASYYLRAPKYADNWIEFNDMFEDKNQTIKMKPITAHVQGELVEDESDSWHHKKVVYKNAFANEIDLELIATNQGLQKLIKINQLPDNLTQDLEFEFELELPSQTKIYTSQGEWDKQTPLRSQEQIKIGNPNTGYSYFRQFSAWDSNDNIINIDIELYNKNGKLYFKKIIPQEFLAQAVEPVWTDFENSYYAGTGDGYVEQRHYNWDACHDATAGLYARSTLSLNLARTADEDDGDDWRIHRAFVPVDTSALPDSAEITSASLYLYVYMLNNEDNDDYDFIRLVQTSQASTATLSTDDFDQCGTVNDPVAGATDLDMTDDITNGQYNSFDLNATGLSWISPTGYTKLGVRQGHDASDHRIQLNKQNKVQWYSSERGGTSQDPYLFITYDFDIYTTLYINDGEGGIDSTAKEIDFETIEDCVEEPEGSYDLFNVGEVSCSYISGTWDKREGYGSESAYTVYRCQGDSAFCSSAANYSTPSVTKACTNNCSFDDTGVEEETQYYYYIKTIDDDLNNSTQNPACTGGTGTTICPLGDATPLCPLDVSGLGINRHCGYLTISWDDMDMYDYKLFKCVDKSSDKCLNATYFENNYSTIYQGSNTSYDDEEVIPVNISSPDDASYYCYKAISQAEMGEPWSEIPTDAPVCDYSYCYRAPDWQER